MEHRQLGSTGRMALFSTLNIAPTTNLTGKTKEKEKISKKKPLCYQTC
jgi:hypothetical protein